MNRQLLRLALWVFFLLAGITNVPAPVGYWPGHFMAGSNLFSNPLYSGSNTLSELFPYSAYEGGTPEGTTVSLWNPSTLSFDTTSTFINRAWSTNLILPPGTGALVVAPSAFPCFIVGYVLHHDGSPLANQNSMIPPPVYSGPNGLFLLGDKSPTSNTGTNIFINILGRLPYKGEQVITLSRTNTYLGHGIWDSIPALAVGEAAFLNIMSEPVPSLTIIYTNNQASVSWPFTISDWTLQTNSTLSAGTWGNYQGSIVNNRITISQPSGNLFFRLSYP